MFIVGKKLEECDGALRVMIGDENFTLINNYFNSYYAVCYNDQDLKIKNENVAKAERRLLSLCYDGIGFLPFMNLAKLNSVGNSLDNAKDLANETRNKLQLSLYNLEINNRDVKDSNVYDRLEKTHDLHAWCKFMNPEVVETTEEDLLLDVVLNNELDLIKDFLDDYRSLDFDVRLAKKKGKANINHKYIDLDLRFQNLVAQNELLNIYKNSNQDPDLMNGVITDSYNLLKKSLSEGVSDAEIKDYKDKMDFDLENDDKLNKAIDVYVSNTLDNVLTYRKNTTNKKKAR